MIAVTLHPNTHTSPEGHVHEQAAAAPATSANAPAASASQQMMQVVDGKFTDFRWKNGAWELESDAFKKDGKTNWDLVGPSATCLHGSSIEMM